MFRPVIGGAMLSGFLAGAAAANTAGWDHNGSAVSLIVNGTSVEIRYRAPRQGLSEIVEAGDLLFKGSIEGGRLKGNARVFKPGCNPVEYEVSGPFDSSSGEFTLFGSAPILAKNSCEVARYDVSSQHGALTFERIGKQSEDPPLYSGASSSSDDEGGQYTIAQERKERAPPAEKRYQLRFCNKSNIKAWIALAVREGKPRATVIHGWWNIEAGNCKNLYTGSFANFSSTEFGFWAHGRNGSNRAYWPTSATRYTSLCIGDWKYERRNSSGYKCRSGEHIQKFGFFNLERPSGSLFTYTMNLEGHLTYGAPQVARAPSGGGWSPSAADVLNGLATGLAIGNALSGGGGGGGGSYQQQIPVRRAPGSSGISR